MAATEFRILGLLEVAEGGRVIEVRGPKVRAVLAMLLLSPNQTVPADRLAEALWGEEQPDGAANMVQGYVSRLRKLVGPALIGTRPPGYLLAAEPDQVDAFRFERLVAAGRVAPRQARPDTANQVLEEALSLWRGEALADFAFDPFAQAEIGRLNELRLAALEEHAEAALMLGRHAQVATSLPSLVEAHPLRERMWGQLITALYRCGRQAEALRAYEEVRRRLGEELGIEPGNALKALEHDVLTHNAALDWGPTSSIEANGHAQPAAPAYDAAPAIRTSERDSLGVLVGREQELRHLESIFAETVGGAGRVVLVSGEPGIGKTRLAEELASRISSAGDVAWGRCSERGGAPAFWPWMQVVDQLVATKDDDKVRSALGSGAAAVAQIVPEIGRLVPGPESATALEPDAARFRVYESVAAFLCRLGEAHPVIVVLDDLQWADTPSLQLLAHLGGRIAQARVLVVATYRDVDPVVDAALADALADLARQRVTSRLRLDGLDLADVDRFVTAAMGVAPARHS